MVTTPFLQANLALQEGSGYFFVNTSLKGIVDVLFQEAQSTVQVSHLQYLMRVYGYFYSVCSNPKCWMFCAPRFLQSAQGTSKWWLMTFVWHFKRLPRPQSMFPTSWRFLCEWWTRSDFIPHSPSPWVCRATASPLRWSLLSGPHIPEMPLWFPTHTWDCFSLSILLPCFRDGRFWIYIIRFVRPVNQEDYFISDPCHSSYRWRSENLSGLTSECWIQIRNRSRPAILNTWILHSRQLLLYSLWRK